MGTLQPGDRLDNVYTIEKEVGSGSMGIVYRALDTVTGSPVAIKVMRPSASRDERLRRLFRREARAMARLNHPGVIGIFGYGIVGERPYLAMEWVEGVSLNKLPRLPVSLEVVVTLIDRILEALAHAHARGVIHRDLKPANILMTGGGAKSGEHLERGRVKVVDFGIARIFDTLHAAPLVSKGQGSGHSGRSFAALARGGFNPETRPHEVRLEGTPHYMAPELYKGDDGIILPANDIYAVGVILYELLSGRRVYEADSEMVLMAKQLQGEIPECPMRAELGAEVPPASLLRRMLDPDPLHRIGHAFEVRRELRAWFERQTSAMKPISVGFPQLSRLPSMQASADSTGLETRAAPSRTEARSEPEINLLLWRPMPVLGRAREQAWLWQQLESVADEGRPRVLLVAGEPGVGKTHLARWLVEAADEAGVAVPLWCSPGSGPLLSALRDALGHHYHAIGLEGAVLERRLRGALQQEALRAGELASPLSLDDELKLLCDFLQPRKESSCNADETSTLQSGLLLHGFEVGEEVAALVGRALRRLSATKRVVLVFDGVEMQHVDGVMRLYDFIVRALNVTPEANPVLLLVTGGWETFSQAQMLTRELMGYMEESDILQTLELGPLAPVDTVSLLGRFQSLPPELHTIILERSGGNPLYAMELAMHATESLAQGQSHEALLETPPTIAELWRRRINLVASSSVLGTSALRVLELIALLGSPVWLELLDTAWNAPSLERIRGGAEDVFLGWELWVEHNILLEDERGGVSFRYAMLRETLLSDLRSDQGRLASFHAAAAWALEQLRLVQTPDDWLRLAQHFLQAGQLGEAWSYSLGAAQQLLVSGDLRGAQASFETGVAVLERAEAPDEDPRFESIDVGMAQVAWRLGHPGEVRARAEKLIERGRRVGAVRQLGMGELLLAELSLRDVSSPESEQLFDRALGRFEVCEDIGGQAQALTGLGQLALRGGRAEVAERNLRRAEVMLRRLGDQEGVGQARLLWGQACCAQGRLGEAEEHFAEARRCFERVGDRLGLARATGVLGQMALARGDAPGAEYMFVNYLEQAEMLGDIPAASQARANLGQALLQQGRLDDAVDLLLDARHTTLSLGDQSALAIIDAVLGLALSRLGRWPQSLNHLRESLDRARRLELYDIDLAESFEQVVCVEDARASLGIDYGVLVEATARQWRNLGYLERAHDVTRRGSRDGAA